MGGGLGSKIVALKLTVQDYLILSIGSDIMNSHMMIQRTLRKRRMVTLKKPKFDHQIANFRNY